VSDPQSVQSVFCFLFFERVSIMLDVKNVDGVETVEAGVELGVTETTGVVPGLHLPTPKRRGSKRKQHVSDALFIEVFQSSETAEEACKRLAMPDENGVMQPMTLNNLYLRANKLRNGTPATAKKPAMPAIPLKDGFNRAPKDIEALTAIAMKFAPKPVEQSAS
jgi:hypothetical protein